VISQDISFSNYWIKRFGTVAGAW